LDTRNVKRKEIRNKEQRRRIVLLKKKKDWEFREKERKKIATIGMEKSSRLWLFSGHHHIIIIVIIISL
jgi:hypothetical protein